MVNFRVFNSKLNNLAKLLCLKYRDPLQMAIRYCTVRRAILYTPTHNIRKVDTALSLKLDCLVFDLKSYNDDSQVLGRNNLQNLLNEGNVRASDPEWCVRINPPYTGNVFLTDMEVVLTAKHLPAAILLPEVDNIDILTWFTEQFWKLLLKRPENDRGPVQLLISIGTPRGVMLLRDICEKAQDLATMVPIIPSAIIFDNIALIESIGGVGTAHGVEFLYARQKIVLVAKAFGLQAIDITNTNPKSQEELENECREGFCMGFTGKQVIFPTHVALVQREFTPTRTKIARANRIVKSFTQNANANMDGITVTEFPPAPDPKLKAAKYILEVGVAAGKIQEKSSDENNG